MLFTEKIRAILFKIFAAFACLAAVYHFVGIFYKVDGAPIWRHLLFVMINLFCIYGVLKRPTYFVFLIALLVVQQYYSHGIYMANMWIEHKKIHWISVIDLVLLPIALICLIKDYKMKSKKNLFPGKLK